MVCDGSFAETIYCLLGRQNAYLRTPFSAQITPSSMRAMRPLQKRRVRSKPFAANQHRFRVSSHVISKSSHKKTRGKRHSATELQAIDASMSNTCSGDCNDAVATTASQERLTNAPQKLFPFVFEYPGGFKDTTPSGKVGAQSRNEQLKNGIDLVHKLISEHELCQYADEIKIPLHESIADLILPPKWVLLFQNKQTPECVNKFVMYTVNFCKGYRSKEMDNRHQEHAQKQIIRLATKAWNEEGAVRAFWELVFQCRVKVYRLLFPNRIHAVPMKTSDDTSTSSHFDANRANDIILQDKPFKDRVHAAPIEAFKETTSNHRIHAAPTETSKDSFASLYTPLLLEEHTFNPYDNTDVSLPFWFHNDNAAPPWADDDSESSEELNNAAIHGTEKGMPFCFGD